MKLLPILVLGLAVALCCSSGKRSNEPANDSSDRNASESSSTAYEKFTFATTYGDVTGAMGAPDREVTSGPPDAKIPNTMMFYRVCDCVIFLVYDMPNKNRFDPKKSHYIGAKGINPERVLHVSEERFRVMIHAYPLR